MHAQGMGYSVSILTVRRVLTRGSTKLSTDWRRPSRRPRERRLRIPRRRETRLPTLCTKLSLKPEVRRSTVSVTTSLQMTCCVIVYDFIIIL